MPHLFSWANVVVQSKLDQVADAKLAERIIDTDSAVWLLPTDSPTGRFWRKAAVRGNVRCWVNNGKHLLALSFSGFDPMYGPAAIHATF